MSAAAARPEQSQHDSSASAERNVRIFDEVWKAVNDKYFDPKFNGADWGRAREAYRPLVAAATSERELYLLLDRMLAELRDPHTWALSPTEISRRKNHQSVDLGFTARVIANHLIFTRIRNGSAAHQAGIQPGWILTHWDGAPVDTSRLSGFAVGNGQTVLLKFLDAEDRVRDVRMTAQTFTDVPIQTSRILEDEVLYIRFESFDTKNIGKWLAETVARNRQARACIIDLRGNWGGLASELKQALEPFYTGAAVFGEFLERSGERRSLRARGRGDAAYPGAVFVLIDEETFSAAELFAAAVQESGRGRIVGRTSGGSALNSIRERLPDGGELNLSVRDYVTKRGLRIEGRGVQPDEHVILTVDDIRRNLDRDLERALKLMRQLPRG